MGSALPLGPPPPIPPRLRSPPCVPDPPIQFTQQEPAYIPFLPALDPPIHCDTLQPPLPTTTPSPSPSVSLSKSLPMVAHIPVLTSKNDFFPWNEDVYALIRANSLIGHILDLSAHVDPIRPDLAPTPPPVLSMTSLPRDIENSNRWWAEDNVVQHILVSCLGSTPHGLLPSSTTVTRMALLIYQILTQFYGTCNFADCTELLNSLHNSVCTAGRVPDFVSRWRVGLRDCHG